MRKRFVVFAVLALIFTGACAAEEDPALTPTDEPAATSPQTEGITVATVALADSDFGKILTDGAGKTLYVFLKDTDDKSNCADTCAETWPPLEAEGELTVSAGADEAALGSIDREDGTKQVTYNDKPLYHFSGDTKAGDTKGQGIGDNWFVANAEGEAVQDEASGGAAGTVEEGSGASAEPYE